MPDEPLVFAEDPGDMPPELSLSEMQEKKRRRTEAPPPPGGFFSRQPDFAPRPDRVDIRSYAYLIGRRKWTVMMVCAVVLGSSIFLSLGLPDVYRAKVTVALRPETEAVMGRNLVVASGPSLEKLAAQVMMRPVLYEAARLLRTAARQVQPLSGRFPKPLFPVLEQYFLEGEELVSPEDQEKIRAFAVSLPADLYRDRLAGPGQTPESAGAWLQEVLGLPTDAVPLLDRLVDGGEPLSDAEMAALRAEGMAYLRELFSDKDLHRLHRRDFLRLSPAELQAMMDADSGQFDLKKLTAELSQAGGGDLLYVAYTGHEPNLVALKADAVAVAFVMRDILSQQEGGKQMEDALRALLERRKQELDDKRREIRDQQAKLLKQGESVLSLDTTLLLDQVKQLRTSVEEGRLKREMLKIRIDQARKRLADEPEFEQSAVTFEDPRVKELQKRQMELSVALETYKEEHPKVGILRREIETLKKQIGKAQGEEATPSSYTRGRNPVRLRLEERLMEAEGELAELENSLPPREAALKGLEERLGAVKEQEAVVIRKLVDEEKILALQVTTMEGSLMQAKVTKESALGNLRIEEQAALPAERVGPNRAQNYILGMLVGLALGVASAFFLEYLDQTIQTTTDLQVQTQLTPLGIVPWAVPGREVLHPENPLSELSEVYGVVRNNIRHSTRQEPERLLLVASALPGEGKSLVTANLATSYSLEGSRTLLVNADIRGGEGHPCTHYLATTRPATVGLSDFLAGDLPLERIVYPTTTAGLSVVPGGGRVSNPARLLRSDRMRQFLRLVEERFAVVIIDSPAVLPVVDATLISNQVRGVLLLVAAAQTPIPVVQQCLARLRHVNSPLIGAVLNKVRHVPSRHFYYGYGPYGGRGGEREGKGRRRA